MKNKSVNMDEALESRINVSRESMRPQRGRTPTFTEWMLEAAAEKLKREKININA